MNSSILSIIADIVTVVGVLGVGLYGYVNKNRNLLGFQITQFLIYCFKTALIVISAMIIFMIAEVAFGFTVTIIAGDWNEQLWNNQEWFAYTLAYLLAFSIFGSILWIITTIIWTNEFNHAKMFLNMFLPSGRHYNVYIHPKLFIKSAIYGTERKSIDVTQKVRKMVYKNQLKITSSNSIENDPDYGTKKTLTIIYIDSFGEEKEFKVPEYKTAEITPFHAKLIDIKPPHKP